MGLHNQTIKTLSLVVKYWVFLPTTLNLQRQTELNNSSMLILNFAYRKPGSRFPYAYVSRTLSCFGNERYSGKKANKQGQNRTNIIDYSKSITIQHCMYSKMIRFIPAVLFSQILATFRVIFLNLNLRNSIAGIRSKFSPFCFVFLDFPLSEFQSH